MQRERSEGELGKATQVWFVADHDAFLTMYDATIDEVFRYARRLTGNRERAEDLVQQVYLELLQSVQRGGLSQIGMGWLMLAVRSRFLNSIRGENRENARLRLVYSNPNPEQIDVENNVDDLLDSGGLNDRERAALTLRYIDDLPVAEVATALGTTVRATESLLARARTRLRATENRHA